jgi:hypothetical protein
LLLHRKLRELPDLPAPPTLVPRVLAAIHARAQAWWRRAWWDWPLLAQAAFVAVALGLAGLVGGGGWALNQNLSAISDRLAAKLPAVQPVGVQVSAWLNQAWTYAATFQRPVWIALLASLALTYLFCVGHGSALFRFT